MEAYRMICGKQKWVTAACVLGCLLLACIALGASFHPAHPALAARTIVQNTRLSQSLQSPETPEAAEDGKILYTLYMPYFPNQYAPMPTATPRPTVTPPILLGTPSAQPTPQEPQVNPTVTSLATTSPAPGLPTSTAMPTVTPGGPTLTPAPTTQPTPGGPTATPEPYFGFGVEAFDLQSYSQQIRSLGARWTRQNALHWTVIEPNPGERNWQQAATLENRLIKSSAEKLETILIVRLTPAWAQKVPGSVCGPVRSDKFADFGKFIYDVVARYSQPPYNVTYFEIGNEVDALINSEPDEFYGCWADAGDSLYRGGGYYASMLKVVYPMLKAANPKAQLLLGGFLADCDPLHPPTPTADCSYANFFEGILKEGGASYFDGVSFHSYDYYLETPGHWSNYGWSSAHNKIGPALIPKARYYKHMLGVYGVTGKYLLDTEAALICTACTPAMQLETAKAWYVPEVFAAGMAEGLKAVLWYSHEGWRGSDLRAPDGSLLPAAVALRLAHTKLGDAIYLGPILPADVGNVGVVGYKFKQGNRTLWLVRAFDAVERPIELKALPTAVSDPLGNPISPSKNLTMTLMPVYIEWGS
jgi:hypothetical protein